MLMAMIDGIQNRIHPGDPLDKDIYDLEPEELDNVPEHPRLARSLARTRSARTTNSCCRATSSRPT